MNDKWERVVIFLEGLNAFLEIILKYLTRFAIWLATILLIFYLVIITTGLDKKFLHLLTKDKIIDLSTSVFLIALVLWLGRTKNI